jgi:hypothetical protein
MNRRRLGVLAGIVAVGGGVVIVRALAPGRYDIALEEGERLVGDVPEPVVVGVGLLAVVAVWIAGMILLAKLVYWCWRQIDDYLFWLWNRLLPESPLVRFAAGVTVMLFVFGIGPLVFIQNTDFSGDDDEFDEALNETNGTATETANTTYVDTGATNTIASRTDERVETVVSVRERPRETS